jgi:TDG/mug DNA glycosylase family protein
VGSSFINQFTVSPFRQLPKLPKLARLPEGSATKRRGKQHVVDLANFGSFGNVEVVSPWSELRLRDRIAPDLRALFVGINPGVRSAVTGHHFAGFSNRFWKLLRESKLVPEPITYEDDGRLVEWQLGITNLIARPSPGINDLRPAEYVEGWKALSRKIRRYRPAVVALVGVTLYRAILPLLPGVPAGERRTARLAPDRVLGLRPETIHGARLFVLPNPSGRNANFSYDEMLEAFKELAVYMKGRDTRK